MTVTLFAKRARTEAIENNIAIKFIDSYISYFTSKEQLKRIAAATIEDIDDVQLQSRANKKEVHVLVLGESTSRRHMGLYGYERNTNPRLCGIRHELYIFEDVISPHSHTTPIITKVLTFSNYENQDVISHTVIQYLKKAGYKTYWISNHHKGDALVDVIAESSDASFFVNKEENCIGDKCLDSNVFLPLSNILKEEVPNKFILIHLLGTHYNYRERYPSSFMKFTSSKRQDEDSAWMVNEYDNAVLYNDYIISAIIDKVKKKAVLSSLLYFSDHGEDVFDVGNFALHTEQLATSPMFTIPFILWLSPEYKKENSDQVADFRTYLDRKYMTDDVIHSILDLLNVQSADYDPSRSIFNKTFRHRQRQIGHLDFDSEISLIQNNEEYELAEIPFDAYDASIKNRIWGHRVNSKRKLREAIGRFTGVELDIIFLNGPKKYDVNHPPQRSINLSLDEYLGSIGDPYKYSFWLDFKRVIPDDIHASLIRLNGLVQKYGLSRHKIVVESKHPSMLRLFNEDGYFTSFYLSRTSDLAESIPNIKKILDDSGCDAISTHADNLQFIQSHFEEIKTILLWAPELNIDNKYHRAKMRRLLLSDRRIRVLLVGLDSKYNR